VDAAARLAVTVAVRKLFLRFGIFIVLVLAARLSFADIGIIVLEPIKTLGYVTRAGHAATYLSNICPDGSPVRMRLCEPGEHGGVVSKHTPISRNGDYDWAIVPFEEFLNGVPSEDLAPIIATGRLRDAIQARNVDALFGSAIRRPVDGALPDGEWKATLATRFDRTLYLFSIATTRGDDQRIVDAFNRTSNTSHFNFFYDNCSDQARLFFSLVLPHNNISERTNGLTMETPKGLAKALVDLARKHPEFQLRAERYVQTAGVGPRSREVLFPMENVYSNPSFAPYWFFEGFREFAIGAFVYHKVFSRFSLPHAFVRFSAPSAGTLTNDQRQAYVTEFERLTGFKADGHTATRLLRDFEARGVFSVDALGRGPWMTLRIDGQDMSTGLSASQIGAGDSRLAKLVLSAAIDYHLNAPPKRRASARDIERLFQLLRGVVDVSSEIPAVVAGLQVGVPATNNR
jgi:hypothetical protein